MSLIPDYEDQTIKEGFLCSICKKDFPGPDELIAHFVTHENDVQEEEAVFKPVQTIGVSRDHFIRFKQIRDKRVERYEIETSKLLIRLNKLTIDVPTDDGKRKEHDKSVVLWVADEDVRLCPSCAKSFNFTRRKHHCRLCGAVLCHDCSSFIEFDRAKRLVDPSATPDESNYSSDTKQLVARNLLTGLRFRRGSASSLLSVVSNSEKPNAVRACYDCNVLMDRRDEQIQNESSNPLICRLYSRLKNTEEECIKLVESFSNMHISLCLGETRHELRQAQNVRVKLMKLSEEIDLISKKVSSLGCDEPSPPPVPQLQLQSKIRMAAANFLKQYTLGLPSLPTEEEVIKLREKRTMEEEKERDRMRAQQRSRPTRRS